MKCIVEIPVEAYRICLRRFHDKPHAYHLLKNGIVTPDDESRLVLRILCSSEGTEAIRQMVAEACPELIGSIRQDFDVTPED